MNKKLLLDMLSAGIKGEKLNIDKSEIDKEFLTILKEQTFLPIAYKVFSFNELKKYYLSSCLGHSQFKEIGDLLIKLFSENKIKHVFIKGYELQKLYPDENLRLFGDIDFLIEKKDVNLAKKLLLENGFQLDKDGTCGHHYEFTYKNGLIVELHFDLVDPDNKAYDFFKDPFSHLKLINNYTYTLEDSYHFLFIIVHYIKHLEGGAGLRELCDIYLMLNKCDLDMDYIEKSLDLLKLKDFWSTLLHELNIIFSYDKLPFKENPYVHELIDYSIQSGIHGHGQNGNFRENALNNNNENRFKFLLKKLFIPVKTLFVLYPWTKSIILIPFGYIYRFFALLFKKRKAFVETITANKSEKSILNKAGIK